MKHGSLTKQAEQQYQAGQLDDAIESLVSALRIKPGYLPAQDLLRQVAREAYSKYERRIAEHKSTKDWDAAVADYDRLGALSDAVGGLRGGFPTVDVKEKRDAAARSAAKKHYAAGRTNLRRKRYQRAAEEFLAADRFVPAYEGAKNWAARAYYDGGRALFKSKKFKNAAKSFRKSSEAVEGYKDAEERYRQAREKAIIRVAVMPFSDNSGRGLGDSVTDRIITQVMEGNPEFIEFVTRDHLAGLIQEKGLKASSLMNRASTLKAGKLVGVDSFIYGKVLNARASATRERSMGPYSNSVKRRIYGNKKEGIPDRDVVLSVRYTIHSRSSAAKLTASYQIVDAKTGRIKSTKTLSDEAGDETKWVMFTGEESAVPPSAFAGTTPDRRDPEDPEVLLERCTARLSDKLAKEVYSYFQ